MGIPAKLTRGLFRLWLVGSLFWVTSLVDWASVNPWPLWCNFPVVRENAPPVIPDEKSNPFAKYVEQDNATPPTWVEEIQCVLSANTRTPQAPVWVFGPPIIVFLIGASLVWVARGFTI